MYYDVLFGVEFSVSLKALTSLGRLHQRRESGDFFAGEIVCVLSV